MGYLLSGIALMTEGFSIGVWNAASEGCEKS